MLVFTDALINESCCQQIYMYAIKIDEPREINQQRRKWKRPTTFPTWSISFPLFLFISPKSKRACQASTQTEGLCLKWPLRACACICAFTCKRPDNCLVQWALHLQILLYSQYGNHMAVKIWQCVPLSLSGMSKGPLLLLFHTPPAVNLPAIGDNVRQMANTIAFSILKSTLTIDDPGVRLKLINHSTWVILSKAKLWLKALSISQYLTNCRLKGQAGVEQSSIMGKCLHFRFKYEYSIHVKLIMHIFLSLFASFILKSLSLFMCPSPLRCLLNGWLWNASITGSSPIRVMCGVTVGALK